MSKLKLISLSALLIFLFVEIWIGFPVQLEKGSEERLLTSQNLPLTNGPEKKMEAVHLVESRAGQRDWELFAESAEGYEGEGSWELKNVKVQFYSKDKLEFTVTGKQGLVDTKSKNMKVSGHVVTQSNNGYVFNTETIHYESKTRLLKSQDKVYMFAPLDKYGKGMSVDGDWMEALVDEKIMRIQNRVSAKKIMNDGKKFLVTSKAAEFSGNTRQVKFLDQVAIEFDSMKMEGPEAQFVYKDSAELLQSILMKGGVRVSDMEKYATSESVKFDPAENRITLSGKPRIVQNNDVISGEQIVLIDGGKKVKVEKMKAHVEKLEE